MNNLMGTTVEIKKTLQSFPQQMSCSCRRLYLRFMRAITNSLSNMFEFYDRPVFSVCCYCVIVTPCSTLGPLDMRSTSYMASAMNLHCLELQARSGLQHRLFPRGFNSRHSNSFIHNPASNLKVEPLLPSSAPSARQ
jgi:hypothetical protein